MTINEAIDFFSKLEGNTPQAEEARAIAIDAIHKYKKLKVYMKNLERNGQYGTLRKLKTALGEAESEVEE